MRDVCSINVIIKLHYRTYKMLFKYSHVQKWDDDLLSWLCTWL